MTKYAALLLLTGCAQFDWVLQGNRVEKPVVRLHQNADLASKCKVPKDAALACYTINHGLCEVYLPQHIENTREDVLKHELMHCAGWSHP
jgi:hypothetical protein